MHLKFRNVNDAFRGLVSGIHTGEIPTTKKSSRNGPVKQIEEPVLITYDRPRERVLFNRSRDANCFMHLYEALWMLAGRNDVAPLAYYAANMANYSDDGETLNGAYGHRWRHMSEEDGYHVPAGHRGIDQLRILIDHLKADPTSRRGVLQMWNVEDDLLKIGKSRSEFDSYMTSISNRRDEFTDAQWDERYNEWNTISKDVCCNTAVYFSIRHVDDGTLSFNESSPLVPIPGTEKFGRSYLDMTVTNRSNDMIWGMLGANAVHFSFLQEYMAAMIGVEVGRYTQMTNNLHVYESNWKPDEWLAWPDSDAFRDRFAMKDYNGDETTIPLVKDPATFDQELSRFVEFHGEASHRDGRGPDYWEEPFLQTVASPMLNAFHMHKLRDYDTAQSFLSLITADDWRIAATNWITKRKEKYEQGQ